MQITFRTDGSSIPGSRGSRLANRLRRVLSRFSSGVANVKVTLKGGDSRKSTNDKSCQLQVDLRDGGQVLVTGRGRRLRQAIQNSLKRARQSVAAELRKRRQRRRQKIRYEAPTEAGA
ncbi:MAG: hypothetical protein ISP91_15150 [Pseudomonadales bacterium]|jgi:hypothetical protein|nr:hypothetical protein [Pseudomonadales bacterium]